MAFCYRCGTETDASLPYCSTCGAELHPKAAEPINATPSQAEPINAEPVKKVDGGVRGRSIASVVLGGEALGLSVVAWYFILLQFLTSFIPDEDNVTIFVGAFLFIYVFVFSLIALGSGIAGKILSGQALKKVDNYRLGKIGSILSLIVIILSSAAIAIGFLLILGNSL